MDRLQRQLIKDHKAAKTYPQWKSCDRKIKHVDRRAAELTAVALLVQNDLNDQQHKSKNLGVYQCQYCGLWHVGHKRKGIDG